MPTDVQMPVMTGKAEKVGRGMYRKQILPIGTTLNVPLSNGGTSKLKVDKQLLTNIKATFDGGFLASTPLQLVDASNAHTDDPERTRGTIRALDLAEDGLYATLDLPDSLLEHNPLLGVSPRLQFDQTRADGRKATVLLRHVAATTDPHIGGMAPFQRLADLSNPSDHVVDLTAATYQGDPMSLSDADLAKLQKLLASLPDDDTEQKPETDTKVDGDISDDELESIIAGLGDLDETDDGEQVDDEQPVAAALSAGTMSAIDLANATAAEAVGRLDSIEAELAAERWKNRANAYVQDGVPPHLVNLAAPILGAADSIDLSASDDTDPRKVIAELLDGCKGLVDLSNSEKGSSTPPEAGSDTASFVEAWRKQFS